MLLHPDTQPDPTVTPRARPAVPTSGDLTEPQFGNDSLRQRLQARGVDPSLIEALCGPIAASGMAKAYGKDVDPADLAAWGQSTGEWGAEGMAKGGGAGYRDMMSQMGIATHVVAPDQEAAAQEALRAGKPVAINYQGHYLLAQGYDPQSGKYFVGNTGANALKGGSDWLSLGEMSALPGTQGVLRSFIIPDDAPTTTMGGVQQEQQKAVPTANQARDDYARQPAADTTTTTPGGANLGGGGYGMTEQEAFIRDRAARYGIDPNTAVAVANSEGGVQEWAREGDKTQGGSYGPFQLFMGGGLGNAFVKETGLDPSDPKNGPAATDWALRQIAQGGWGPWHGAARIGVTGMQGIAGNPSNLPPPDAASGGGGASGRSPGLASPLPPEATTEPGGYSRLEQPAAPTPLQPAWIDPTGGYLSGMSDVVRGLMPTVGGPRQADTTRAILGAAASGLGAAVGGASDALRGTMGVGSPSPSPYTDVQDQFSRHPQPFQPSDEGTRGLLPMPDSRATTAPVGTSGILPGQVAPGTAPPPDGVIPQAASATPETAGATLATVGNVLGGGAMGVRNIFAARARGADLTPDLIRQQMESGYRGEAPYQSYVDWVNSNVPAMSQPFTRDQLRSVLGATPEGLMVAEGLYQVGFTPAQAVGLPLDMVADPLNVAGEFTGPVGRAVGLLRRAPEGMGALQGMKAFGRELLQHGAGEGAAVVESAAETATRAALDAAVARRTAEGVMRVPVVVDQGNGVVRAAQHYGEEGLTEMDLTSRQRDLLRSRGYLGAQDMAPDPATPQALAEAVRPQPTTYATLAARNDERSLAQRAAQALTTSPGPMNAAGARALEAENVRSDPYRPFGTYAPPSYAPPESRYAAPTAMSPTVGTESLAPTGNPYGGGFDPLGRFNRTVSQARSLFDQAPAGVTHDAYGFPIASGGATPPYPDLSIRGPEALANPEAVNWRGGVQAIATRPEPVPQISPDQPVVSVSLGSPGSGTMKALGLNLPENWYDKVGPTHRAVLDAMGYDPTRNRLGILDALGIDHTVLAPERVGVWGGDPELNLRIGLPKGTSVTQARAVAAYLGRAGLQDAVGVLHPLPSEARTALAKIAAKMDRLPLTSELPKGVAMGVLASKADGTEWTAAEVQRMSDLLASHPFARQPLVESRSAFPSRAATGPLASPVGFEHSADGKTLMFIDYEGAGQPYFARVKGALDGAAQVSGIPYTGQTAFALTDLVERKNYGKAIAQVESNLPEPHLLAQLERRGLGGNGPSGDGLPPRALGPSVLFGGSADTAQSAYDILRGQGVTPLKAGQYTREGQFATALNKAQGVNTAAVESAQRTADLLRLGPQRQSEADLFRQRFGSVPDATDNYVPPPSGLPIPDPHPPGSIGYAVEQLFNRKSAEQGGVLRPKISGSDLMEIAPLAYLTRLAGHHQAAGVDALRTALETSLPYAKWYDEISHGLGEDLASALPRGSPEREAVTREAQALMGVFSPQREVKKNAADAAAAMQVVRQMQRDGTLGLDEVAAAWAKSNTVEDVIKTKTFEAFKRDFDAHRFQFSPPKRSGGATKPDVPGDTLAKVLIGYATGEMPTTGVLKTPSFNTNLLYGHLGLHDPESTMDTWMFRAFGLSEKEALGDPEAYQAVNAVVQRLAREYDVSFKGAQAAMWNTIRAAYADERTGATIIKGGAPQYKKGSLGWAMENGGKYRGKEINGLADGIAMAKSLGIYDEIPHGMKEVRGFDEYTKLRDAFRASDVAADPPPGMGADMRVTNGPAPRRFPYQVNPDATATRARGQELQSSLATFDRSAPSLSSEYLPSRVSSVPGVGDVHAVAGMGEPNFTERALTAARTADAGHVTVHFVDPRAETLGGATVSGVSDPRAFADALAESGMAYSRTSDGTAFQVPFRGSGGAPETAFQADLARLAGEHGGDTTFYKGRMTHYGAADLAGAGDQAGGVGDGGRPPVLSEPAAPRGGGPEVGGGEQAAQGAGARPGFPDLSVRTELTPSEQAYADERGSTAYRGSPVGNLTEDPAYWSEDNLFRKAGYYTSDARVAGQPPPSEFGATNKRGYAWKPRSVWSPDNRLLGDNLEEVAKNLAFTEGELAKGGLSRAQEAIYRENAALYRQALENASGPNVRKVDIPETMRMFDADAPATQQDVNDIWRGMGGTEDPPPGWGVGMKGEQLYKAIGQMVHDPNEVNNVLSRAGFDGVAYKGGLRIPMKDAVTNEPITHDAYAIFPQSIHKVRNVIGGRQGGQVDLQTAMIGGLYHGVAAGAGGLYGYVTAPEGATPEERMQRAEQYAVGAGIGAFALAGGVAGAKALSSMGEVHRATLGKALVSGGDTLRAFYAANLMSNPASQVRNLMGNTLSLLTQPAESELSAANWGVAKWLAGQPNAARMRYGHQELKASAAGSLRGAVDGFNTAMEIMAKGEAAPTAWGAAMSDVAHGAGKDGGRTVVGGLPGGTFNPLNLAVLRPMTATDEFFKGIVYNQAVSTEFYRLARARGLQGAKADEFVTQAYDTIHSSVGSGAPLHPDLLDAMSRAGKYARYQTYQQEMDKIGHMLTSIQKVPILGSFLMPFTRTPYNILKYGLERSPAAAIPILADVARGVYRPTGALAKAHPEQIREVGDLADRLGRFWLGVGFVGASIALYNQGILTGSAPTDPGEAQLWRRAGNHEFSIKLPGGRSIAMTQLPALGPTMAATVAVLDARAKELADAKAHPDQPSPDVLEQGAHAMDGIITSMQQQGFSQAWANLASMIGAATGTQGGPTEKIGAAVGKQVSSSLAGLVPASAAMRAVTSATDQYDRQTPGLLDDARAVLPPALGAVGLPNASQLPPQTALGRPIPRVQRSIPDALVDPFAPSQDRTDAVDRAFMAVGEKLPGAGNMLEGQKLTPEQRDAYDQMLGQRIRPAVGALAALPGFHAATPERQKQLIDTTTEQRRAQARLQFLASGETGMPTLRNEALHEPIKYSPSEVLGSVRMPPEERHLYFRNPDALQAAIELARAEVSRWQAGGYVGPPPTEKTQALAALAGQTTRAWDAWNERHSEVRKQEATTVGALPRGDQPLTASP